MKVEIMKYGILIAGLLGLVSCSRYEEKAKGNDRSSTAPATSDSSLASRPTVDETPVALDGRIQLPDGWSLEGISPGECMTPVDQVNGAPVSGAGYARGSAATIVGWNVTSSKSDATPTNIFGVLKPYDQNQDGVLLTGKRVPRPDVAGDNSAYQMAGYELVGKFPEASGKYRFYVWTGVPGSAIECDSKIVIHIN